MTGEILNWSTKGKTIKELIQELKSFDDQSLRVELSLDGGVSSLPIGLVGKKEGKCLLISFKALTWISKDQDLSVKTSQIDAKRDCILLVARNFIEK